MVPKGSLLRPFACAGLCAWLIHANLATWRDSDLSVGDYLLTGLYTAFYNNQIALALTERDWPLFRCRILLDDINKRSLRGHLGRVGGNQHCAMNRRQHQTNVNEPSRPKPTIGIRNRRPEINLAGGV